jgi:hypothetical protein
MGEDQLYRPANPAAEAHEEIAQWNLNVDSRALCFPEEFRGILMSD